MHPRFVSVVTTNHLLVGEVSVFILFIPELRQQLLMTALMVDLKPAQKSSMAL